MQKHVEQVKITLTKEQRAALLAEQSKLMQLKAELPKAAECGMDCRMHAADVDQQLARIRMLLQHFGQR